MKAIEFKKVAEIILKVSKKHKAGFPAKALFDGKSVSIVVSKNDFQTMVKLDLPEPISEIPFEIDMDSLEIISALPGEELVFLFVPRESDSREPDTLFCNDKEFTAREVKEGRTVKLSETAESVKVSSDPDRYEKKNESNRPETGEEVVTYQIEDGKQFKKDFKAAASFSSNDLLRPILNGVYFDRLDDTVKMVSSNGHYMFMKDFCKNENKRPDGFNVQSNVTDFLPDNVNSMIVDTWCNTVVFSAPGMIVETPLIEGRFPAWRSVLPVYKDDQYLEINLSDWKDSIKEAKKLGFHSVTIKARKGILYAMYGNTDSINTMVYKELPVRYGSEFDFFYSLKLDYMADIAKVLKNERVHIKVIDSSRAALYTDSYADILQMPLMQPSIIEEFWHTIPEGSAEQLPEYVAPEPKKAKAKKEKAVKEKVGFIQLVELAGGKYAVIGDIEKVEKAFTGVNPVQAYVFEADKLGEIIDLL